MLIHAGAVENVRPAKVSATPVFLLMDAASGEAVPHTGVEMMSVTTRRTVRVFITFILRTSSGTGSIMWTRVFFSFFLKPLIDMFHV